MNDRYLYRAKRIDSGEWVKGNLITDEHNPNICFIGYLFAMDESGNVHDTDIAKVDPSTICQCTGLKDKNGKLIWENDIVFVTDDDGNSGQVDTGVGEVDFFEGLWYISGNVQNALYDINKIHQIKVIGNIFDNPELLEWEE